MCQFTKPQRKADVPNAKPTRNQLGFVVSGLELVNTDLDPPEKHQSSIKHHPVSSEKGASLCLFCVFVCLFLISIHT